MMRGVLVVSVAALALGLVLGDPNDSGNVKPPQVFVYTRYPVQQGVKNQLMCHCTGFHPPQIDVKLRKNNEDFPEQDCKASDMTFLESWAYYFTKFTDFIPEDGVQYGCDVRHYNGQVKTYVLEPFS